MITLDTEILHEPYHIDDKNDPEDENQEEKNAVIDEVPEKLIIKDDPEMED